MQDVIHTQSQSAVSAAAIPADFRRSESTLRRLALFGKLALVEKILASSFHRFLYRIRSIRAYRPLDFGPALLRQADGRLQPNERTDVRIQSTDAILAKYRWADIEDARMFLEGFDAGEAWSRRNSDK